MARRPIAWKRQPRRHRRRGDAIELDLSSVRFISGDLRYMGNGRWHYTVRGVAQKASDLARMGAV